MGVNANSPAIPALAAFMLANGGPVNYGCRKLTPCFCGCPGMSYYQTLQIRFAFPNLGVSGGWYTIYDAFTIPGDAVLFPPPSPLICPPVPRKCCGTDTCDCFYKLQYVNTDCSNTFPTCADFPPVTAPGGAAHLSGPGGINFSTSPVGSGYANGCNWPGPGAEPTSPSVDGGQGRSRCNFDATFGVLWNEACGVLSVDNPLSPGTMITFSAPFTGTLDCTTLACRCPFGFYARFGQGALIPGPSKGLFFKPGFPGAPAIDPDGYIEVRGTDPGPPCPDNWPCPEGIRGGGMAAMMAGRSLTQSPGGVLVAGPKSLSATSAAATTRTPLPCVHLGDQLTGVERDARGLDHLRDWRWCEHPDRPLGDAVCPCAGCGPTCQGYVADTPP